MSDCIFCQIAQKKIPSQVVYEDEQVIAFRDLSPQAPTHVLIIPKQHADSLLALPADGAVVTGRIMGEVIPRLARELNLADGGFRVVVNTGADGGQTVNHLHFHLLGGRSLAWPPG